MEIKNFVDENYTIHYSVDGEEVLLLEEAADQGTAVRLTPRGRLTNALTLAFRDELNALATMNVDIILDMSDLSYIGHMCVEALVDVQRKMDQYNKGSLTLTNVSSGILETFKSLGVSDLLEIE